LKIGVRKSPETVVVSGFSGAISFLVAQHGPSGDNGFDQTTTKPSIYGTCAHFSSMDHKKITGGNPMPNILEDLYYGNISPNERRVRPGSKIQKAMQKRDVLETKLNESFTDEQKATFEQYQKASSLWTG